MSITIGKSDPTIYIMHLCAHVLSSVREAKYLGITLTDVVLVLSCTLDSQPRKLNPWLFEEEPSSLPCQT